MSNLKKEIRLRQTSTKAGAQAKTNREFHGYQYVMAAVAFWPIRHDGIAICKHIASQCANLCFLSDN